MLSKKTSSLKNILHLKLKVSNYINGMASLKEELSCEKWILILISKESCNFKDFFAEQQVISIRNLLLKTKGLL